MHKVGLVTYTIKDNMNRVRHVTYTIKDNMNRVRHVTYTIKSSHAQGQTCSLHNEIIT